MAVGLVDDAALGTGGDPASILDLLEDAATGHGAIRFRHDGVEPTPIGELWRASERAARWVAGTLGTGGTVAAVLTNTGSCVTSLFGAWRAGCTVASLPLPARGTAPDVYVEQLSRFCRVVGAQRLLLDPDHARLLGDTPIPVPVSTFEDASNGDGPQPLPGAPALVQFTSGSLGTPKGIHLDLHAVGTHVLALIDAFEVEPDEWSCSWLPLSHDMGLIGQLLAPLAAGAPRFGHHSLDLMTPESFVFSPASWLRACSESGATVTAVPNFALDLAVRTRERLGPVDLSRLHACVVGSESVRRDTLVRFSEAFAPAGFRSLALCPAYGMAEATLAVTIVRPSEPWRSIAHPTHDAAGPGASLVCTGAPLDGIDVRVEGGDDGIGRIELRSPSLLDRYIGAELSLTDDGYFVTGDIGLMEDRELFVIGRGDEVIVVAGRNLYPADIETCMEHELIRAGCVAAVSAPDGGLAIVAEPNRRGLSKAELEAACPKIRAVVARQTGAAPTTVAFVPRGSLPKTPSGKLRRTAIRRALADDDGLLARVDFS